VRSFSHSGAVMRLPTDSGANSIRNAVKLNEFGIITEHYGLGRFGGSKDPQTFSESYLKKILVGRCKNEMKSREQVLY
jgi:hypothetical protein